MVSSQVPRTSAVALTTKGADRIHALSTGAGKRLIKETRSGRVDLGRRFRLLDERAKEFAASRITRKLFVGRKGRCGNDERGYVSGNLVLGLQDTSMLIISSRIPTTNQRAESFSSFRMVPGVHAAP